MSTDRQRLRATFEEVAELYDRARPTYPPQLFADLERLAGLPRPGRILEIGPGTGKATLPLAQAGHEIVALELGEALAAVARRNLAAYPNASIVNADFESWPSGGEPFDAVVAFTAFHWIDPDIRLERAAALLRPDGALAVVGTLHVAPAGSDPFWAEVQADYDAVDPSDDNRPPTSPDDVDDLAHELEEGGWFRDATSSRYLWDIDYTADEYIDVLNTYSAHRALEPERRQDLFDRIARRIRAVAGGTVTKTYLATLAVARKRER